MGVQLVIPGSGVEHDLKSSRWTAIVERWRVFLAAYTHLAVALSAEGFDLVDGDGALSLQLHHDDRAALADLTAALSAASSQGYQASAGGADMCQLPAYQPAAPELAQGDAGSHGEAWSLTNPEPTKLALGERTLPLPFRFEAPTC